MQDYETQAWLFKALGDPIRLKIVDMLSCGELCACDLLKHLSISQPTLSYHMKLLIQQGLVITQKRATWVFYSLNQQQFDAIGQVLSIISRPKDDCICKSATHEGSCWKTKQ